MRRMAGAVAVLAFAVLAGLLVDGELATLVRYTFARSCPPGAPSSGCVATLPANIVSTWDDYGEGEPYERQLSLDLPDAPADTPRNPWEGTIETWLTITDAERLHIFDITDPRATDAKITVTMFDNMVINVVGPNGERAQARHALRPGLAALELALWSLAAALVIAVAARVRRSRAARATLAAVGGGVFTATLAAVITSKLITPAWVFPTMAAAYVVGAVAVVTVFALRSRDPVTAPAS